ncbi:MAG: hypothetical protein K0U86_20430 [Planctomycetes bacterium]|nr:hypothetical protein [Planctomycetota bacterium]MCH9727271.1 hypothetical protein [Planctomycetota bacterium]MCH9776766.1 hypothetical protein [Planctomycetota bacterium]MCH9789376.1 hypothetical protein [Planctomycetota bacterium]
MMNQKPSLSSKPIPYKTLFPWLHLFRVFRLAVDFQKIMLASTAILLLFLGNQLFNNLPFAPVHQAENAQALQHHILFPRQSSLLTPNPHHSLRENLSQSINSAIEGRGLLEPMSYFTRPVLTLFQSGAGWSELAYATTQLIWAIIIWSLFGGAITRIAAIQFAQDEHIGFIAALRFSSKRILSLVSAPLLPFAGMGFFWVLCLLIGLFGHIPGAGAIIVSLLWGLAFLFAFVMSLILLVTLAGWPLMMTTISVEDSDGFDGLSRVFSYLFGRIWYFLWLVIVTLCYGSLCLFFVELLMQLVTYLSYWGVSWGMGSEETAKLFHQNQNSIATTISLGWQSILSILFSGFVISFFWSANTVIYFLLRNCDDGTPLDHVYNADEEEEQAADLPLAGVAKAGEPVIERPVTPEKSDEEKPDPEETE